MKTKLCRTCRGRGGVRAYRSELKNLALGAFLLFAVLGFSNPASASEINIPWTVTLNSDDWSLLTTPEYEGMWDGLGIHIDTRGDFIDVGMVDARLELNSSRVQSYSISLPFQVHISAPDEAMVGQTVFLDSYAVLSGTPTFTTSSQIDYSTNLSITTRDVPFIGNTDISEPLPNVGFGGVNVSFNGDASYTATDTSADQRLTRTIWNKDPYGNPLNMPIATQFEGYQLHTTGDVDAWEADVHVLEFAGNFIPGVDVISSVMDISVGVGLDIIEENYLQTQFVTGYYTDDGVTYDDFLINGATRRGYIEIPDTLSPGDTYEIQMTALGLGFTVLTEYFLQGNVDFDLELLSLFDIGLGEIDIGSAIEVEDWVTRYQYVEFMNPSFEGFLTEEQFDLAVLSFAISSFASGQEGTKETELLELAQIDPLIGRLLEEGADQGQLNYDFPINPQPGPSVVTPIKAVPEPATLFLLGFGLLGLTGFGHRRIKKR